MAYAVVGETAGYAKERERLVPQRPGAPDGVTDATVGADELRLRTSTTSTTRSPTSSSASVSGIRGASRRACAPTSAANGHRARPGRAPGHPAAGSALRRHRQAVADQMEELVQTAARCDGFVLAATHLPGAFEDVVRMVVPELQRPRAVPRRTPTSRVDAARITSGCDGRPACPGSASVPMLDGLRVLDLATLAAAPLAADLSGRVRRRRHQDRATPTAETRSAPGATRSTASG